MTDRFKQAIFVLPDGEQITVPLLSNLKLHDDKPKPKVVVVWGMENR